VLDRAARVCDREIQIPPGEHFAWSLAVTFTVIPMQVSTIGNRVANVDPDAEANGSIRRLVAVEIRRLLLHLHGAPLHRYYQIRLAENRHCLNNLAAVLGNCQID